MSGTPIIELIDGIGFNDNILTAEQVQQLFNEFLHKVFPVNTTTNSYFFDSIIWVIKCTPRITNM